MIYYRLLFNLLHPFTFALSHIHLLFKRLLRLNTLRSTLYQYFAFFLMRFFWFLRIYLRVVIIDTNRLLVDKHRSKNITPFNSSLSPALVHHQNSTTIIGNPFVSTKLIPLPRSFAFAGTATHCLFFNSLIMLRPLQCVIRNATLGNQEKEKGQ